MYRQLFWLALAAFAIGTEAFVIAGILPAMAHDLGVSVPQAGQLVTVFALTYAIATPLTALFTAAWPRERVLRISMGGFVVGNLAAAFAPGYGTLMLTRVVIALFAGLFMATAGAYAAASVEPARRGRALSFVLLGMTMSTVAGVPLGTLIGEAMGWRGTFVMVAAMGGVAWLGLCLPRAAQALQTVVPLADRLALAARPDVLRVLLTCTVYFAGIFAAYTYFAPLMSLAGRFTTGQLAITLSLFGVGGAIGNILGGLASDRHGPVWVMRRAMGVQAAAFAGLSAIATWGDGGTAAALGAVALVVVWGLVGWTFPPSQQARLIGLAPESASVVLSLNSSAMYLGISGGAVIGSIIVAQLSAAAVGWAAAALVSTALVLVLTTPRARTDQDWVAA